MINVTETKGDFIFALYFKSMLGMLVNLKDTKSRLHVSFSLSLSFKGGRWGDIYQQLRAMYDWLSD